MVDRQRVVEPTTKRSVIAVEVDPELKRWLELRSAERMIEGRPYRQRTVGAVIRDILEIAREQELSLAS